MTATRDASARDPERRDGTPLRSLARLTVASPRPRIAQDPPGRSVSVGALSEPSVATTTANIETTRAPPANQRKRHGELTRPVSAPAQNPVDIKDLQAVVLAGGADSGNPLTRNECRAALKFAATYRLIDFPMANIINSAMKRVHVLTQFNSYTLNQHVQQTYTPEVFGFGSIPGCVPAPRVPPTPPRPPNLHLADLPVLPNIPVNSRFRRRVLIGPRRLWIFASEGLKKSSDVSEVSEAAFFFPSPCRSPPPSPFPPPLSSFPPPVAHLFRFVDVLPSFQSPHEKDFCMGSADCVRRHLQAGTLRGPQFVDAPGAYLILSGEALYRMDYRELLATHNESGADITIATVKRKLRDVDARTLGVCSVDKSDGSVYGFREKPTVDELKELAECEEGAASLADCDVNVNMGVYIFSKKAMDGLIGHIEYVQEQLDFGKHIIPMGIGAGFKVHAHEHDAYWQPIRTLREWYDANLDLCRVKRGPDASTVGGAGSMLDPDFPITTLPRCLPPARFRGESSCEGSVISEGVVVGDACAIRDCVVGPCCVFGDGVVAEGCILIGHPEMAHLHGDDVPDVGDGCELRNVVLERDVVVGAGCRLINEGAAKDLDAVDEKTGLGYVIQDGIIVVTKGTVLEPGTVI